jgi:hypothetical protein
MCVLKRSSQRFEWKRSTGYTSDRTLLGEVFYEWSEASSLRESFSTPPGVVLEGSAEAPEEPW